MSLGSKAGNRTGAEERRKRISCWGDRIWAQFGVQDKAQNLVLRVTYLMERSFHRIRKGKPCVMAFQVWHSAFGSAPQRWHGVKSEFVSSAEGASCSRGVLTVSFGGLIEWNGDEAEDFRNILTYHVSFSFSWRDCEVIIHDSHLKENSVLSLQNMSPEKMADARMLWWWKVSLCFLKRRLQRAYCSLCLNAPHSLSSQFCT